MSSSCQNVHLKKKIKKIASNINVKFFVNFYKIFLEKSLRINVKIENESLNFTITSSNRYYKKFNN